MKPINDMTATEVSSEVIDFAQTLRNIWERLDGMHAELSAACTELDNMLLWAENTDSLSDGDRENLTSAIERAREEMYNLLNSCYDDAPGAVDWALDAFKRLPMAD